MNEVNCGYAQDVEPERVVQFRVKPVTRYIVTQYTCGGEETAVELVAELDNKGKANRICVALAEEEARSGKTSSWFSTLGEGDKPTVFTEV